jgi:fucose 4-O-acetylase-like acetyltransferase
MRWIGRNTLMIYAVHLAILLVTASALAPDTASDADNEN